MFTEYAPSDSLFAEHNADLPIDCQSLQNVDSFRICIGNTEVCSKTRKYCRVLYLNDTEMLAEELGKSGLDILLNKADKLRIELSQYFVNLFPLFDLRDLKCLAILHSNIECIVKGSAMKDLIAFPSLLSLYLSDLPQLNVVCDGEAPLKMFCNLQTLKFQCLRGLLYGLPLVPHNLEEIDMTECDYLKFIFLEDEEPQTMEMPFLKTIKLFGMGDLSSLVGHMSSLVAPIISFPGNWDLLEENRNSFFGKIALPSLGLLHLTLCDSVFELWGKGVYHSRFHNLKEVKIDRCENLLSIGPPSLFSALVQLETLSIMSCMKMREIIYCDETNESEIQEQLIRFPRLKCLELIELDSLEILYAGEFILEFPELKKLILTCLPCVSNFTQSENSEALFNGKIVFPCLEELKVKDVSD